MRFYFSTTILLLVENPKPNIRIYSLSDERFSSDFPPDDLFPFFLYRTFVFAVNKARTFSNHSQNHPRGKHCNL